jgi:hypothetical protein
MSERERERARERESEREREREREGVDECERGREREDRRGRDEFPVLIDSSRPAPKEQYTARFALDSERVYVSASTRGSGEVYRRRGVIVQRYPAEICYENY